MGKSGENGRESCEGIRSGSPPGGEGSPRESVCFSSASCQPHKHRKQRADSWAGEATEVCRGEMTEGQLARGRGCDTLSVPRCAGQETKAGGNEPPEMREAKEDQESERVK